MDASNETPHIGFGSRVRKSPYFAATRRWGCNAYSVYNHTYMPTAYTGTEAEYWQLVKHVTLWDVSCERQVQVSGPDASRFVQWLTPRDLSAMAVGQAKYVPLLNAQGGIINDPLLLRVSEDCYWFSLSDSDVLLWAQGVAVGSNFHVELCEPDVSPLQVQGPAATDVMVSLFGDWILDLKYFWFRQVTFKGIPLLISRTGWSNERGYEVFLMDGSRGDDLWEMIMAAGEPYNISPACPNQIKRMEAGLLSYRNDMDLSNNPFELGMGKFVDLNKPIDFIGKQALQKIAAEGIKQKLMGAYIDGEPVAVNEHRWPVYVEGHQVGELTSCVYSPSLERGIAYILLSADLAEAGQRVDIETPEGRREAELCELPFLDNRAR